MEEINHENRYRGLNTYPSSEYFMSHFPLSRIHHMQTIRINANGIIRVVGPFLLLMA